jgi:hypothetical protein
MVEVTRREAISKLAATAGVGAPPRGQLGFDSLLDQGGRELPYQRRSLRRMPQMPLTQSTTTSG